MTRNKKIFFAIIVVIAILFVWFLMRGPEDTWICDNGQWVKHGFPNAPKPEGPCDWSDNLNPFK